MNRPRLYPVPLKSADETWTGASSQTRLKKVDRPSDVLEGISEGIAEMIAMVESAIRREE